MQINKLTSQLHSQVNENWVIKTGTCILFCCTVHRCVCTPICTTVYSHLLEYRQRDRKTHSYMNTCTVAHWPKVVHCSCSPLRFCTLCLPIISSSTYQSFSLLILLPANAHIGVLCCLCTQTCSHALRVAHQYLWGFLLAVVPVWAWLLGSICLVLIWLHKLHQQRGFTLNRIFGLFIGWTLHAESYLMSHVLEDRKGSGLSWAWLNVYVHTFWMSVVHLCVCMSGSAWT